METNMMVPRDFESSTVDSCQYLRFGQTDDIWLKSALEGKKSSLLITRKKVSRRESPEKMLDKRYRR